MWSQDLKEDYMINDKTRKQKMIKEETRKQGQ